MAIEKTWWEPRFNAEIVTDVDAKARVILLLFQSELSFYWSR